MGNKFKLNSNNVINQMKDNHDPYQVSFSFRKIDYNTLTKEDKQFLSEYYFTIKDTTFRYMIIVSLLFGEKLNLKEFFYNAFKRERRLESKLMALRGYSAFATQEEVNPLGKKFLTQIIKLGENKPLCYREWTMVYSKGGIKYLTKNYGYDIFVEIEEVTKTLYQNLPDAFKGIFTINENCETITLKSKKQVEKKWNKYFKK